MEWHVFTMDEYRSGPHRTYREARPHAQGICDTNRSPKRLHPQFYELSSRSSGGERRTTVWIATTAAALKQGWTEDSLHA
jgi:hypothetical protein